MIHKIFIQFLTLFLFEVFIIRYLYRCFLFEQREKFIIPDIGYPVLHFSSLISYQVNLGIGCTAVGAEMVDTGGFLSLQSAHSFLDKLVKVAGGNGYKAHSLQEGGT